MPRIHRFTNADACGQMDPRDKPEDDLQYDGATYANPATFSANAKLSAVSFRLSKRPEAPPCPAPMLVFRSTMLALVFSARSLAIHFAGSQ